VIGAAQRRRHPFGNIGQPADDVIVALHCRAVVMHRNHGVTTFGQGAR
jgi:hypothetical protein